MHETGIDPNVYCLLSSTTLNMPTSIPCTKYLWSIEYIFSLHSTICNLASNGLSNFFFYLVRISRIKMAEPSIYSYFDSLDKFILRNLKEQPKKKLYLCNETHLKHKQWLARESTSPAWRCSVYVMINPFKFSWISFNQLHRWVSRKCAQSRTITASLVLEIL